MSIIIQSEKYESTQSVEAHVVLFVLFLQIKRIFVTLLFCVRRSTFRSVATELTATRSSEASAVCLESSSCRPQIYSETSTEVELSMSLSCSRAVFYAAVRWDPVRGIATENSSKITEC